MNAPLAAVTWPQAVSSWGAEEEAAAIAVIRSGRHTMGSRVAEFERAFAALVGSLHAVMVNSGSSANLIAVGALHHIGRLRGGREVIVPATAWATTYAPFQQYGLRLRVVDIEADTLNVDCDAVERAMTWRTSGLVAVNLLGNPADLARLREIANRYGLAFLEDNCESMGATIDGRHCGTFGDIGTFSFFFSHHMNTIEGGMLVTDDRELADAARCLRAHGWTRDLPVDSTLRAPTSDFHCDYDFALPGFNVRPTEIAAAIGLEQLKRAPALAAQRQENARQFDAALPDGWTPQRRGAGAVPFALPAVARGSAARAQMIERIRALGAECRPIAGGCFTRQRAARHYEWATAGPLTVAERVHDHGLMLGNHGTDLTPQIAAFAEAARA